LNDLQEFFLTAIRLFAVPITFIDAPEHQLARRGDKNYKLKCYVKATPNPSVSWNRMGTLLKSNDKYIVEGDGLIINNVEESDDGSYSCEVIVLGTGEYKTRSINLEVSDCCWARFHPPTNLKYSTRNRSPVSM
jgi:hypothetical protein